MIFCPKLVNLAENANFEPNPLIHHGSVPLNSVPFGQRFLANFSFVVFFKIGMYLSYSGRNIASTLRNQDESYIYVDYWNEVGIMVKLF